MGRFHPLAALEAMMLSMIKSLRTSPPFNLFCGISNLISETILSVGVAVPFFLTISASTGTLNTERSPSRGEARFWSVRVGDRLAEDAARQYPESPIEALHDLIRFAWDAMDSWFEEDEEVFTHARDPHHRIDILRSSRRVEVIVNGVTVADSHSPTLLFETGLPTRYYLPLTDVRTEFLRPSASVTSCPYKGTASYWSLEVDGERSEDVVWIYASPLPESIRIAGLACFYNERVDIRVDGVLQEPLSGPFSRRAAAA